ncbi:hypothetical protein WMY93_011974 [Mugilogobius chulae]|uniref:Rho-GAP domain-containing protein n=1 Tax=Mugilogobius chulae TaxID=88201 RepID=A0AAW0P444_9GOBI
MTEEVQHTLQSKSLRSEGLLLSFSSNIICTTRLASGGDLTLTNPTRDCSGWTNQREIKNEVERAALLKTVVSSYPESIIVVMRYLFAFLHHVSQYSDENMMQPYNLAVCFGPSLVHGANEDDMVTLQPQINDLVKSIIVLHELIFPSHNEIPGPVYEKCMTEEDDCEPGMEEEGEVVETSQDSDVNLLVDQSFLQVQKRLRDPEPTAVPQQSRSNGPQRQQGAAVLKDVCRQMDSVFKELLARKSSLDATNSSSSPSALAVQKKGRRDVRRGKGGGMFKSTDPLD